MRREGDHYQVSESALNNLPAWQQAEWREVREDFLTKYSGYPDMLAPLHDAEHCRRIEPRYRELLYVDGEFCQVALTSGHRHYAPLVRYSAEGSGDYLIAPGPFFKVYGYYLELLVDALGRRDHDTAAKVAGIVSHLLCDRNPGDHIDPAVWMGLLFPPPPEVAERLPDCWGVTTQEVDIPPVRYQPRLLGVSVGEALHAFYQRYLSMMKRGIPYVSRMLRAAYEGRAAEAQRLLSEARLLGIEILSDYLYTAFCIAYERLQPEEVAALETVDLTEWFPSLNEMDWLYFYGPYRDAVVDFFAEGPLRPKKLPAELRLRQPGGGEPVTQRISPALGVLPDSGCQLPQRWAKLVYDLAPEAGYRRFTCVAGLHAGLSVRWPTGVRARVAVQVLGDREVLYDKPLMQGGDPAEEIRVDITGKKQLTLLVTGLHRVADEFWLAHFIWGRPRLSKRV